MPRKMEGTAPPRMSFSAPRQHQRDCGQSMEVLPWYRVPDSGSCVQLQVWETHRGAVLPRLWLENREQEHVSKEQRMRLPDTHTPSFPSGVNRNMEHMGARK